MTGRMMFPSEASEQVGLLAWWRSQGFPRIFHIPNGGKRSIRTAISLKAEGVVPGVPDLYCPEWGLWIEMKRERGGRISQEQADWHRYLRGIGDEVIIGNGARDASEKILRWLDEIPCNGDAMDLDG